MAPKWGRSTHCQHPVLSLNNPLSAPLVRLIDSFIYSRSSECMGRVTSGLSRPIRIRIRQGGSSPQSTATLTTTLHDSHPTAKYAELRVWHLQWDILHKELRDRRNKFCGVVFGGWRSRDGEKKEVMGSPKEDVENETFALFHQTPYLRVKIDGRRGTGWFERIFPNAIPLVDMGFYPA